MITEFSFASTPRILFGAGQRRRLAQSVRLFGTKVLLVTGQRSFDASPLCRELLDDLENEFDLKRQQISEEPSPQLVDDTVARFQPFAPDCVVAIGGGSVIDAAKAVAGLLPSGDSVMEYLEGVGHGKTYQSPSTPFIALPTTAGTGSETSKNAVLSMVGDDGFKKSFRSDALIARCVILDPELTLACPASVTAACGMDALTQLLESYVSRQANLLTDALALSGLERAGRSLVRAVEHGDDIEARADLVYAASLSGLTLANAGLGTVHALASPLGAYYPIPHGEACGAMLYEAVKTNIEKLQQQSANVALLKYAQAGRVLCQRPELDNERALIGLLDLLHSWTKQFQMPRLSSYGVKDGDVAKIVDHASSGSLKTNPVSLSRNELLLLVHSCL